MAERVPPSEYKVNITNFLNSPYSSVAAKRELLEVSGRSEFSDGYLSTSEARSFYRYLNNSALPTKTKNVLTDFLKSNFGEGIVTAAMKEAEEKHTKKLNAVAKFLVKNPSSLLVLSALHLGSILFTTRQILKQLGSLEKACEFAIRSGDHVREVELAEKAGEKLEAFINELKGIVSELKNIKKEATAIARTGFPTEESMKTTMTAYRRALLALERKCRGKWSLARAFVQSEQEVITKFIIKYIRSENKVNTITRGLLLVKEGGALPFLVPGLDVFNSLNAVALADKLNAASYGVEVATGKYLDHSAKLIEELEAATPEIANELNSSKALLAEINDGLTASRTAARKAARKAIAGVFGAVLSVAFLGYGLYEYQQGEVSGAGAILLYSPIAPVAIIATGASIVYPTLFEGENQKDLRHAGQYRLQRLQKFAYASLRDRTKMLRNDPELAMMVELLAPVAQAAA